MVVDKWEQAYQQGSKRSKMLLFLLQVKKACQSRSCEYMGSSHMNLHLGNSVFYALASAGANLHQVQTKVPEHPLGFL